MFAAAQPSPGGEAEAALHVAAAEPFHCAPRSMSLASTVQSSPVLSDVMCFIPRSSPTLFESPLSLSLSLSNPLPSNSATVYFTSHLSLSSRICFLLFFVSVASTGESPVNESTPATTFDDNDDHEHLVHALAVQSSLCCPSNLTSG